MGRDATVYARSYADYSAIPSGRFPIALLESIDAGHTFTPVGGHWKPADGNEGLSDDPQITAVNPLDPAVVYATTKTSGAVRSRDRGLTWEPFAASAPDSGTSERIVWIESSTDGSRLWLVTSQGKLFSSTDDGSTWGSIEDLSPDQILLRVKADPFDHTSVFGITRAGEDSRCCRLWVYRSAEWQ
jgi:hypothetical protein